MRETEVQLLAVALVPLFAAMYFGAVIAAGKRLSSSAQGYRDRYAPLLYVVFISGVAFAFFVTVGPDPSLAFEPWFLALGVLGAGMYLVDTKLWETWTGASVRRNVQPVVWLLPALVVPIPEELLYRLGLSFLRDSVGTPGFVAVSAVLFGAAHVVRGKKEVPLKTANGVVYALAFVATGTVVAPILAHLGYNVASVWYVGDTSSLGSGSGP